MRRFFIWIVLMLAMVTAAGCVPHTTGETEVGVRTRKMAFIGKKGVEDRIYAPGATYFFMKPIDASDLKSRLSSLFDLMATM